MKFFRSGALALSIVAGVACFSAGPATALPFGPVAAGRSITAQLDQAVPVTQARYRGGRRGGGAGVAAGIIGGMILGGIIASQQPQYYPAPVYGPAPYIGGDPVGYCMQRFRSFDPRTMTYLGYDGYRHPCP